MPSPPITAGAARPAIRVPGLRWWMAGLVFLATIINFLDRLTVTTLGSEIKTLLDLSNAEFASITTCFLVAYTISQGLSGRLYDLIGTRRGFSISIVVWSLAAMGMASVRGLSSLNLFRVLLGLGEAGNWPGAAKVIAEWFPRRERALGMGIFNSGVAIGSIIAPPLIVKLYEIGGWKAPFLVTGLLGFVWLILWLLFYHPPEKHPAITPEEHAFIKQDGEAQGAVRVTWAALLRHRQTWAIVLSRLFTDPVWWLFITWTPLYLHDEHGFNLEQIGMFVWMPFVAAGAGSLVGGWASGHLIGRGWSATRARRTVIIAGMLCMTTAILAVEAGTPARALALFAVVMFGFQAWISNVQTLASDYFPEQAVASVAGMGGVGAGVGGILFIQTVGFVRDHVSYTPILVAAAVLPILGTLILFALGGPVRQVVIPGAPEGRRRPAGLLP